jgi:hypothetical protein
MHSLKEVLKYMWLFYKEIIAWIVLLMAICFIFFGGEFHIQIYFENIKYLKKIVGIQ